MCLLSSACQTSPLERNEAAASYIPRVKERESLHVGATMAVSSSEYALFMACPCDSCFHRVSPNGDAPDIPLREDEAVASYTPG